MNMQNGRLPAPANEDRERMLRAELALLFRNIAKRTERFQREGFKIPFARVVTCCDEDPMLARRVLLASGWSPGEDGNWIIGHARHEIEKAISWNALETACVGIVDDYRPL